MSGTIIVANARPASRVAQGLSGAFADVTADALGSTAAFGGVLVLTALAPFERLEPLVRLPGQSISNLEAALVAVFAVWVAALGAARRLPQWRTPLTVPWLAFLGALVVSALASPVARVNALHMTGRLCAAFGIYLLAVNGVTTAARVRQVLSLAVATGLIVSALAILEYLKVPAVLEWLKAFRPFVTSVGAVVRAGGPLQYPTIASMYLEIVFALGLGLLLWALDASRRLQVAAVFVALLIVADAITLTFTRAGLITMAVSLALVGGARYRQRGADAGALLVVSLAIAVAGVFLASRSAQSVWLRFTSEGQESWYRVKVDAPAALTFASGATVKIPITLTNTGRLAWDSHDPSPFFLSYHWMPADGDRYVTFEGLRTAFDAPVPPETSVTMRAAVQAPRHPGRYRLVWDIVQEGRLWFTTEPGAAPATSWATVDGAAVSEPLRTTPPPKPTVRPGRLTLWRAAVRMIAAHPLVGVGPDNFRLVYGDYAGLRAADPRMHSNNMYLEILAGGGLMTGAAFLWLLIRVWRMCRATCGPEVVGADRRVRPGADTSVGPYAEGTTAIAAACLAIALHGLVDSFLSFAPTYVLFSLTLGLAVACARGRETGADANRV